MGDDPLVCTICGKPAAQFVLSKNDVVSPRCDYHGYDKLVSKTAKFISREEAIEHAKQKRSG